MNLKKYIYAIIALSLIDIAYTAIGAFYGGGGAELNPLLSWITNPVHFVLGVILIKVLGIVLIVKLLLWAEEHDDANDTIKAKHISRVAVAAYSVLLTAILAVNVAYQITSL